MDIEQALSEAHSKTQTNKILKFIGNDAKRFKNLVTVFLKGEGNIPQRAAWPLSFAVIEHPELIKPHYASLIKKLQQPGTHPAVPRNILRLFQEVEIPEKYHGTLVDVCINFITDIKHPIAVRAFAITVSAKICRQYPELKNELTMILDELKKYPQQPAIRVRIKSAFKQMES